MCPLFTSITTHAAWAFLIIILSLLINEFVLARLFHPFFLLVDFLSRHLWGGYIKLVGLSAACVYCSPSGDVLGPDRSLFRVGLISLQDDERGTTPSTVPPHLIKLYVPAILIIWPSTYLYL